MSTDRKSYIMRAIGQKARSITPEGTEVILFGSQARGDARGDSDWDVLLILDKERVTPDDMDAYSYPLWMLGLDFEENINAVLYTKKDWKRDVASPFVENVKREGIRL